jgi:hypothetical protein
VVGLLNEMCFDIRLVRIAPEHQALLDLLPHEIRALASLSIGKGPSVRLRCCLPYR